MTREASATIAVILGGWIGERREGIASGVRPRVDVLELESRFGARIYDFSELERPGLPAGVLRRIAKRTGLWSACLALLVAREVRSTDVVYATGEDVGFPLGACMRLFRIRRPRLIVRIEQPSYGRTRPRRTLFAALSRAALPRIAKVLCRTSAHARYFERELNVPAEKVLFVRETIDTSFFAPSELEPMDPPMLDERFILTAGLEMRDYQTLIESIEGVDITLVIAAGSPWSHESYTPANAASHRVRVSAYNPVEMRALYHAAEFVVVPIKPTSRACGANVVLEAWSMGKAVIATGTQGLLDYVVDGKTGILVAPGDRRQLRSAIVRLLDEPATTSELGANGCGVVTREQNLDSFIETIRSVAGLPGSHDDRRTGRQTL